MFWCSFGQDCDNHLVWPPGLGTKLTLVWLAWGISFSQGDHTRLVRVQNAKRKVFLRLLTLRDHSKHGPGFFFGFVLFLFCFKLCLRLAPLGSPTWCHKDSDHSRPSLAYVTYLSVLYAVLGFCCCIFLCREPSGRSSTAPLWLQSSQ